tara:strand:+ start:1251 stop:1484 length:234 start_codon:yes stop_codon:yes gene_type:complete
MFGYYSEKQFNNSISSLKFEKENNKTKPYIYYISKEGNIVQVTEVCNKKITQPMFDDLHYIGELKQFHSVSNKPIEH